MLLFAFLSVSCCVAGDVPPGLEVDLEGGNNNGERPTYSPDEYLYNNYDDDDDGLAFEEPTEPPDTFEGPVDADNYGLVPAQTTTPESPTATSKPTVKPKKKRKNRKKSNKRKPKPTRASKNNRARNPGR